MRLNSLEVKLVGCRKLTEQCAVGLNFGGVIAMGSFEAAELGPLRLYNACVARMRSIQLPELRYVRLHCVHGFEVLFLAAMRSASVL